MKLPRMPTVRRMCKIFGKWYIYLLNNSNDRASFSFYSQNIFLLPIFYLIGFFPFLLLSILLTITSFEDLSINAIDSCRLLFGVTSNSNKLFILLSTSIH